MDLTEEQLNFLARIKINGALSSDFLGDRLDIPNCDTEAEKQCNQMVKAGYLVTNEFEYDITDKGLELVKNRMTYKE